jgi:hypothetical protein
MTNIPTWLDDGAGSATCALLGAGTAVAAGVAANSARSLLFWPTLGAAATTAAFAAAAHAIGCTANPGNPPYDNPNGASGSWCQDGSATTLVERFINGGTGGVERFRFWIYSEVEIIGPGGSSGQQYTARAQARTEAQGPGDPSLINLMIWDVANNDTVVFTPDAGCGDEGTQPIPLDVYSYEYTDASTSCVYNYVLQDTWIDSDGYPRFAWAVDGDTGVLRNSCQGGRIAGYVWAPTEGDRYTYNVDFDGPGSGGDGPGWIFTPDWGAIAGLLMRLMEYNDPGDFYRLTSVCETNDQGEPVDRAVEVTIPPGFRNPAASSRIRFEAMVELMQGLKDFRQPTCNRGAAVGQLVSVDFQSDEVSPGGTRRLRKLLRYRDQTNTPLADHTAHWDTFSWEAGPAIVKHINGPWGQVQVWGSDADEAKRVIRHAGTIAGVDPDAVGEWVVTSSTDPRYGQTGTMRLARRKTWAGEILQISKRDGPSGRPIVPCDC